MKYRNNPANIRYLSRNHWLGLVGSKNGFCEFDSIEHGLRALVLLLKKYIRVHKCTSVSSIINRFAPPIENNTSNYIRYVSSVLVSDGLDPNNVAFESRYIFALVRGICMMETHTYLDEPRYDYIVSLIND